jgi:hypothetical protein
VLVESSHHLVLLSEEIRACVDAGNNGWIHRSEGGTTGSGLAKVDWLFVFSCAAFNLIRIPKLRAQSA